MGTESIQNTTQNTNRGYETRDANIRSLVLFAAGLCGTLALVLIVMAIVFRHFSKTQSLGPPASPFSDIRRLPPLPRLQVEPRADLEELHKREDAILNSYEWVDRKAGVVRMPIDRAMDRLMEKGLPVRGQQTGQQTEKK